MSPANRYYFNLLCGKSMPFNWWAALCNLDANSKSVGPEKDGQNA
jgi:hypothetical protein